MNIDKNNMGDIEIIQMSYLYFLINLINMDENVMTSFLWLIEKILGIHYDDTIRIKEYPKNALLYKETEEGKKIVLINGWEISFEIQGKKASIFFRNIKLTASEFNEFKRIILYQNLYDYDDTPMSEDVQRVVNQYYALKNKGIKPPTLEDKMLAIIASSSETRQSLSTMPYRQFEKLFHMVTDKTEYKVTMSLLPHLENKNVEHWIYKKEKNKFADIFKNTDDIGKANIN